MHSHFLLPNLCAEKIPQLALQKWLQWFQLPRFLILIYISSVIAYSLRFGLPKKFIWNQMSLHLCFTLSFMYK